MRPAMHLRPEDQRLAADTYRQISAYARAHEGANPTLTRQDLIVLGAAAWQRSYALRSDDDGALAAFVATVGDATEGGISMADAMLLPNQQLLTLGPALWFHQGLPQVQLGDKFAAALLATKPSPEMVESVEAPWRALFMVLPNQMFFAESNEGKQLPITGVLVMRYSNANRHTWAWCGITGTSLTLWQHGYTSEMLASEKDWGSSYEQGAVSEALEDIDRRTSVMIGRLILNVCLALNDPANVQKTPPGPNPWAVHPARLRDGKLPATRTFVLGRERVLDCREAVRSFLRTGVKRGRLTVQFPVIGHYRRVAHGPGRAERTVQWIEPYWRGDENAPILSPNMKIER